MSNEVERVEREYPASPMVGVAAVVVRGDEILLVRRGREPLRGTWSLPGGLLELGETTAEGVAREVLEETAVRVQPVEIVTTLDRIMRDDDGRVQYHYVLVEWLCLAEDTRSEPVCGDDAEAAEWVKRDEIFSSAYGLAEPTLGVIAKALKLAETMKR
ncbi:NUDIX hydrolase [Edaphobacter bradus]|uniref:NUDIX hydrolase n=1 Tax=Edaphobacter bradus TaxID=2259016 RepID=UPI0021DF437E|nr:NUDIX hydrolase [Edaphobacter bradus]